MDVKGELLGKGYDSIWLIKVRMDHLTVVELNCLDACLKLFSRFEQKVRSTIESMQGEMIAPLKKLSQAIDTVLSCFVPFVSNAVKD